MLINSKTCRCCGGHSFLRLEKKVRLDPFFAHYGLQYTVEHTTVLPLLDWALGRRVERLPVGLREKAENWLARVRRNNLIEEEHLLIPFGMCEDCLFLAPWFEITDDQLSDYYSHYLQDSYKEARISFQPGYAEIADLMGSAEENSHRRVQHEAWVMPILENYMERSGIASISLLDYGGGEGGIQPLSERIQARVLDVGLEHADLDKEQFDAVQCLHMLEHVGHPLRTCQDAYSRCLPGGLLFIEVPIEFTGQEAIRAGDLPICHEHINKFCLQSLSGLLNHLGGRVLAVEEAEIDFLHLDGLTPVVRGLVERPRKSDVGM